MKYPKSGYTQDLELSALHMAQGTAKSPKKCEKVRKSAKTRVFPLYRGPPPLYGTPSGGVYTPPLPNCTTNTNSPYTGVHVHIGRFALFWGFSQYLRPLQGKLALS